MGAGRRRGLALLAAVVLSAFPHIADAAPSARPRCHVVPAHIPRAPTVSPGPTTSPTTTSQGTFVVVVPKVVCDGPPPSVPPGHPVSGNSGGASSGSQGGKVPFTGAELALMVSLGLALLGAGSVTVLAGRRRRVP